MQIYENSKKIKLELKTLLKKKIKLEKGVKTQND